MKIQRFRFSGRHSHLLLPAGMIVFGLSFIFSGCATTKKETAERKEPYEKIAFSLILQSPEEYKGRVVKLGGVIIQAENREEETVIEVLEKPLGWRGRPKSVDESGGRFLVVFDKFLDKAMYRPDRPVTVVGEIVGAKTGAIGEKDYEYPLLSGREIRLWEEPGHFDRPRLHIGIGIGGSSGGVGVGTTF